ncbi:MAG: hypothetical protein OEY66_07275 [Gammaproteobacteria bacterium]|nr:hypothetical protein [Gammaproteobacteria bacterium]
MNNTIDINTTAGQVAGRMILANDGLYQLMQSAFGGEEDCEGTIYRVREPAKPLKGRGNSRHEFEMNQPGAKKFYEELPVAHRDQISTRHNSNHNRYSWEYVISDEAKLIWELYHDAF